MNTIISITEKSRPLASLPDGLYAAVQGGYIIELEFNGRTYELKTEHGVRGINIHLVVRIDKGIATFEYLKN